MATLAPTVDFLASVKFFADEQKQFEEYSHNDKHACALQFTQHVGNFLRLYVDYVEILDKFIMHVYVVCVECLFIFNSESYKEDKPVNEIRLIAAINFKLKALATFRFLYLNWIEEEVSRFREKVTLFY